MFNYYFTDKDCNNYKIETNNENSNTIFSFVIIYLQIIEI